MNHLAHGLLSYPGGDDLFGNFIGDFVKGKSWQKYPLPVQGGILRHRRIDAFTDGHPVVRASVERIRPIAGKFASPVVDVLFDHVLCRTWDEHATVPFAVFESWMVEELEKRHEAMPEVLRERWPRMMAGNFLRSYTTESTMRLVLTRFAGRLPLPVDAGRLADAFFQEISFFEADFRIFFPELKAHAGFLNA